MTKEQKTRIAAVYADLHRQSCDPRWRPGQATASHKMDGVRTVLDILGYDLIPGDMLTDYAPEIRKQRHPVAV